MVYTIKSDVRRFYDIALDPEVDGTIQGLITALTEIRDKGPNGPTVIVEAITGGTYEFNVTVRKPD